MSLSSAGQHPMTSDNEQAADTPAVNCCCPSSPDNQLLDAERSLSTNLWRQPSHRWHAHRWRVERGGHAWLSVRKKGERNSTASEGCGIDPQPRHRRAQETAENGV